MTVMYQYYFRVTDCQTEKTSEECIIWRSLVLRTGSLVNDYLKGKRVKQAHNQLLIHGFVVNNSAGNCKRAQGIL